MQDEGKVLVANDLPPALQQAGVRSERQLSDLDIEFLRKRWNGGSCYLVNNTTKAAIDRLVELAASSPQAVLMDPMSGRIGRAESRRLGDGRVAVRLQLAPGDTLFVQLANRSQVAEPWRYIEAAGEAMPLEGKWQIDFVAGGPVLPDGFESTVPVPWTESPDANAERFAGTVRYTTTFASAEGNTAWRLDLGEVRGSARVTLNGEQVATLIAAPFRVVLPEVRARGNRLEVEVTGVAANRIRDLDRRGVEWRIFDDINLVNIDYRKFDASDWLVQPLGLHGPVTLTPLKPFSPTK